MTYLRLNRVRNQIFYYFGSACKKVQKVFKKIRFRVVVGQG